MGQVTKDQIKAWVRQQGASMVGRVYSVSDPGQLEEFAEWATRMCNEASTLPENGHNGRPVAWPTKRRVRDNPQA